MPIRNRNSQDHRNTDSDKVESSIKMTCWQFYGHENEIENLSLQVCVTNKNKCILMEIPDGTLLNFNTISSKYMAQRESLQV